MRGPVGGSWTEAVDGPGRSLDAPGPRAGPRFLRLNAWPYRAEMAAAAVAVLALLGWRLAVAQDTSVPLTIFWIVWPDVGAFVPIGIASRGKRPWPRWGPDLYNALHAFLVWAPVFALWSLLQGSIAWPLLGWAGHIAADRAFGYYLRVPGRTETAVGRRTS